MNAIETLKLRYPWPAEKPDVPAEMSGWFAGPNRQALAELLSPATDVVLELGSWVGMSATHICQCAPNATVLCIDHWLGSAEHHRRPEWEARLPTLYETFLVNMWEFRDRLIPMKTTTLEGMREIHALGIVPRIVYIDAAHDEESVFQDVSMAQESFPTADILGDDWPWDSVRKGVVRATWRKHFKTCGISGWHIPANQKKKT
ncbi:MAG TPA: class I SAM-dependent methyltransferase [Acidobacteriota bacterium]|nr:class I SAM-dependent methyltransferase [Acidobacteriota bacterium]